MTFRLRRAMAILLWVVVASTDPRGALVSAQPAVQWREIGAPARSMHAMVWDSHRERALLVGGDLDAVQGTVARNVWELVRDERPRWRLVATLGEGPLGRSGCSAIYDVQRDRVLVFGGRGDYPNNGTNELWSLSLTGTPEWRLLLGGGNSAPSPRAGASLVLDSRDRLVLYGGDGDASCDTTVWLLSLAEEPLAWRAVTLPGPGPGPRARHGAVYSPTTDRVTIFGGDRACVDNIFPPLCPAVTWELTLAEPMGWRMHPPGLAPVPQTAGAFIADAGRDVAWLVPGDQGAKELDPSVWWLDLANGAWTRMNMGPIGPELRAGAAACVIPSTGEILLHGGSRYVGGGRGSWTTSETWRFSESDPQLWRVAVPVPGGFGRTTSDVRAHFDRSSRRFIAWRSEGVLTLEVDRDEAWILDPAGAHDAPLQDEAMSVLDPVRRRLLVFGGLGESRNPMPASRLWTWPLDGEGAWASQPILGRPPHTATGTQCVYDPVRDRVLVLPSSIRYPDAYDRLDSLVVLELQGTEPRWARIATEGTPPAPRAYGSIVFDPLQDRLILQGGVIPTLDGWHAGDLWALSLSGSPTWTLLAGRPDDASLYFATNAGLVIDPSLERVMVIGGQGRSFFGFGAFNTVRSMSLHADPSSWTDLDPGGSSPMRGSGTGVFDAVEDRMLFWNLTLWEITWSVGTPERLGAASILADRSGVHVRWPGPHVAPYAAGVERSVDGGRSWRRLATVVPGADGTIELTDPEPVESGINIYRVVIERSGELRVIGTASLGSALGPLSGDGLTGLVLAPLRPNPASAEVTIELASPIATQVTIEVFDLSGRRVGAIVQRDVAAGSVAFTLPLAHRLEPGLYVVRASDGRRTVKSRLAVVR